MSIWKNKHNFLLTQVCIVLLQLEGQWHILLWPRMHYDEPHHYLTEVASTKVTGLLNHAAASVKIDKLK